jgi:hypothetical protein
MNQLPAAKRFFYEIMDLDLFPANSLWEYYSKSKIKSRHVYSNSQQ